MSARSVTFNVHMSGPLAVFTRPEMKAERVSYEVMTPSAARGVLEAVLWKPAVRWVIESIAVLKPIQWMSFRRNEVDAVASPRSDGIFVEDRRQQRNTVALRDVAYEVAAHFEMTPRAGDGDNVPKFEDMFARRLERGQCFHQPYLGCREMVCRVEPASGDRPIQLTKPLGLVFFDFDYGRDGSARPLFFDARLEQGVVRVPSLASVMSENGRPS